MLPAFTGVKSLIFCQNNAKATSKIPINMPYDTIAFNTSKTQRITQEILLNYWPNNTSK